LGSGEWRAKTTPRAESKKKQIPALLAAGRLGITIVERDKQPRDVRG